MIPYFPDFVFVNDDSIQRQNVPNVLRSEMETGPQKTRPIQSVGFFNVQMEISICDEKLNDFRKWFNLDLKSGANWFLMNDPFDGVLRRFRFLTYDLNWRKRGDILAASVSLEAYDEL